MGAEHLLLGGFLGVALDHGDALGRAGHHDLELGLIDLIVGRVHDILAIDEADANRRDGAVEGDVGDVDGRARGYDAQDVGRVDEVGRDAGRDDLESRGRRPCRKAASSAYR